MKCVTLTLHIAPLEIDPDVPDSRDIYKPTARELGDLNHRYKKEDPEGELTELQAKMANMILFRRQKATIPDGIGVGSKVLWKQALCEVVKINCTMMFQLVRLWCTSESAYIVS